MGQGVNHLNAVVLGYFVENQISVDQDMLRKTGDFVGPEIL